MTILLALVIAIAVVSLSLTVGPRAARRAEAYTGPWAWMIYVLLGLGMIFGATSVDHVLLSTFMWTKLTAFIATGAWLLYGRIRRREALLPGLAHRQTA